MHNNTPKTGARVVLCRAKVPRAQRAIVHGRELRLVVRVKAAGLGLGDAGAKRGRGALHGRARRVQLPEAQRVVDDGDEARAVLARPDDAAAKGRRTSAREATIETSQTRRALIRTESRGSKPWSAKK